MMWWITLAQAEQVASGIDQISISDAPIQWERCYPNNVRQESMCAEILRTGGPQ